MKKLLLLAFVSLPAFADGWCPDVKPAQEIRVKPKHNYTANLKGGEILKLVLDQSNGRLWSFESYPENLVEMTPEGCPDPDNVEDTWIFFTALKDVEGTGAIELKTKISDGDPDMSHADASRIDVTVTNN
jgi:hypothetical protein